MGEGVRRIERPSSRTMTTSDCTRVSFGDSDTRRDEMHSTMEAWVEDLVDEVDDAVSSEC